MRSPLFLSLSVFALALPLRGAPALSDGESLTYRVSWGIFFHAGEIKIDAHTAPPEGGRPRLLVTTTTATRGLASALFTFNARADALFDGESGRLLSKIETSKSDSKETKNSIVFDYAKSTATYVNGMDASKNATLAMPAGDPVDLIMSLVQTRTWDLKPGDKRDALVIFDDEFYELTIHAEGYEQVSTPLGNFQTLVLVPRMEKTPPKGMFKRGSGVRVWISQDQLRLPVKFQVEFKFGAGVAALESYHLPSVAPAPAPNAKAP
ncbi:MAG TPA: DUF3108 domain-containing protein [Opitutaceae bacterium]|nr:DUF3108 domain-containing protein [Opitutaceae bacterium]